MQVKKEFLYQPTVFGEEEPTGSSNIEDDADLRLSNIIGL